jgi:ssDNA-binding Zn-finger/Zn-ribbon topoisomerase 1
MYDFVSLSVKCPICGVSLMDGDHPVDNKPSIRLAIEMNGQNGYVCLSSIYGSYNYTCDIDLEKGQLAHFSCPSCNRQISSKQECVNCGAPMVPLFLDMEGKVSICSRYGCKSHFVEFEDLTHVLQRLYEDYGYEDGKMNKTPENLLSDEIKVPVEKKTPENIEIIETGTFLHAYCPQCKRSLIEDDMLKLKVVQQESGYVLLSPYLNVFSTKSTIYLPEDQLIDEVACPHCEQTLINTEHKCAACGSPAAKIAVSARTKLIDFYICTKKGCRWHGLDEE